MATLRVFLGSHRRLAALLVALALCMKALVPGGYMIAGDARVLTIEICADATGGAMTKQIVVPHHAAPGEAQGDHGKASGTCPYAGLAMAGLAGADAVLLVLALGFILALGFAAQRAAQPRRPTHIRPPLRGPPALA
jgi:hypothetical protein